MRCTSPRNVGFKADGKTLSWSSKTCSKEFATFKLPCGQCIECRLDYARQWAVRCVHEAQMHNENSFITLTYDDEHIGDNKLDYRDFQLFMKKLRKLQNEPIGVFVTGEYGEKSKRKHWHAILFGFNFKDRKYSRSTERGDKIYQSETLDRIWGQGRSEIGSVTFESAGYCARYAAKKLVHGKDDEHEYRPISKKSSKHAIGKKWLEQFWPDVFNYGKLVLKDGTAVGIPRYYERWLKDNKPTEWRSYVTQRKAEISAAAQERADLDIREYHKETLLRGPMQQPMLTRDQVRKIITESKFKMLQNYLKL